MKKSSKRYIEEAIKLKSQNLVWQKFIAREIIFSSLSLILLFAILLIYSCLNFTKFNKLAKLTADTILNHEVYIDPNAYYFTWLILLLIISIIALIIGIIIIKFKNEHLKKSYLFYKIYDIISFISTICVIINFIIMFIITPVTIDGRSMESTFSDEDKVLLWHFAYSPKNDDVIVLDATNYGDPDKFYIKRIIASPGDKIEFIKLNNSEFKLKVNDTLVGNLDFTSWKKIINSMGYNDTLEVTIAADKFIVFGDNRLHSTDSRTFGVIDGDDIIGKVTIRYYPFNKFGFPKKEVLE